RGVLVVRNVASDPRLAGVADAASESGIEAAVAVPLLAQDEVVGLLGVFPARGRRVTENETALLAALAAQLAVAVQNAQLHERAKRLGTERERALDAERAASKQVRALYEISRSFAQSLSLEATRIGGQAALAIDNARLYQQQKEFADTMQHSLLPQTVPQLAGLELGAAYESSAHVEVGGDVYDFMELADGRLAVALGDVTGHGIAAAVDMAMAKVVFGSLC